METLEEKILKISSEKDKVQLQMIIHENNELQLSEIIKKLINNSSFHTVWDMFLKTFRDLPNCNEKRAKITLELLKELEHRSCLSSTSSVGIIQRLCMDLMKYKTRHLVDICNFCLKSIQSVQYSSRVCWKDLLPDTLRILSTRDRVFFNDLDYSGQEITSVFINTLCTTDWPPSKVTELTAMFSSMTLTKEEHLKVVKKITCFLDKLTTQEIPPLVYQLFKLCANQNSRVVFMKLQQYFDLHIYSNLGFTINSDSDNLDLDLIESAEDGDMLNAESMVLFHIQSTVCMASNCIKDYLNYLKNANKSSEFILHPFNVLVLLTISTAGQYEEIAFDILRHSVVRAYGEEQKRNASYWYRDILTCKVSPDEVFNKIINMGVRDLLFEAFTNFAFTLLSVGAGLGRDLIAEKQWSLGSKILLKIIKKKRNVPSMVLKTFCRHILTKQSASQYIECLYYLNTRFPLLIVESQNCIIELMHSLSQVPNQIARQILEALMPLIRVSHTLRNQLILILRKCLYSRRVETRQVAVYGYAKLISILNVSSDGILTQSSLGSFASGYSIYTQISSNSSLPTASGSAFSSEAVCWEVLGIVKSCFAHQAAVRMELYEDLHKAVIVNKDLGIPVLDMIWFHFKDYYVEDEEAFPPLSVINITQLRDADCILLEPLGKLIFTISQILINSTKSEDDRDNPTVKKYTCVLNSLSRRMSNCELVHYELDDGTDLTDIVPESQKKLHTLNEIVNVLEALIGYKITTMSLDVENQCGIINRLQQVYLRFLNFGKNIAKPKKLKKTDKTTQNDSTTKSDQSKAMKASTKAFKSPETILDLSCLAKGLLLLHQSGTDANALRVNVELHRHFLQAVIVLVGRCKNSKSIDVVLQKEIFNQITLIATTVFEKIIKKFNVFVEFDCASAIIGLECFHAILQLITQKYKNNLTHFLTIVGGKNKESNLIIELTPLIKEFQRLFEIDDDDLSSDPEIKKFHQLILNNLSILCSQIPSDCNVLSVQVYEWVKEIAYQKTIKGRNYGGSFMNLLCETHLKFKPGLSVMEHAATSFYDVYGVLEDDESLIEDEMTLKIVDHGTAHAILLSLCAHNKTILEDIESIIGRIKSDFTIVAYAGDDAEKAEERLRMQEKGTICQLRFIANILIHLTTLSLPPGTLSEAVFKNIIQYYSSLSSISRYFISRATKGVFQGAWLEKLVKLTGKTLDPAINRFLYNLGAGQAKELVSQGTRKRAEGSALGNKILKETKLIPKIVYEMEQFAKFIIQLSNKTNYNLSKYVGPGISRDFRINIQNVQADIQKNVDTTLESEDEQGSIDTNLSGNSMAVSANDEDELPDDPPVAKKRKR